MSAALEPETAKKRRKRREVARRRVVNLPDDLSWWLEENHKRLGFENVPQALKALAISALATDHGTSLKDIKVAFKKHEVDLMMAEIDAMEGDDA